MDAKIFTKTNTLAKVLIEKNMFFWKKQYQRFHKIGDGNR